MWALGLYQTMTASKKLRVEKIFNLINTANPTNNLQSAWALVHDSVKNIEDTETSIPYDWRNYGASERMYFPSLDNWGFSPISNEGKAIDLISHVVALYPNGCICIKSKKDGTVLLSKPGSDGNTYCV
jgi:hypothetical protein